MLNQTELNKLKTGDHVDHFLLLKKYEVRLTKQNKEFLSVELGDQTTTLRSNIWNDVTGFDQIKNKGNVGDVLKVTGLIEEYNGILQVKPEAVRLATESDNVNPVDFLQTSKRDLDEMQKEFKDRIEKIGNSNLKELINLIFDDENFEKFSLAPAGKSWHHAYINGLLEHTLELIKICDLMCNIHPEINRDLVVCGAMLHDFGKIEELSFDSAFDYTDKGKLVGHIVIVATIINETTKQISDFPENLKNQLTHIVLSHQGKLEYASPVVPKTLEAITLYQADELSAKVNAYKNAILNETTDENRWTRFLHLASTDLFNHGITSDSDEDINKTLFD